MTHAYATVSYLKFVPRVCIHKCIVKHGLAGEQTVFLRLCMRACLCISTHIHMSYDELSIHRVSVLLYKNLETCQEG
jgi:hypothetical protein